MYKLNENKKFWEKLIAYFPLYETGLIINDRRNDSTEQLPSNDREIFHRAVA
jgi:hypothetical protein